MQQRSYGISGKDKEAGRHLWMPVCFIMISCVILFGIIRYDRSNQMPEDFYSIDLMNAYEQLGLIIGEAVEDDLVNEIFSKFCMGK